MTGEELVEVRLLGLPVRVHERASQHAEELRREFRYIVEAAKGSTCSVPGRLVELSTTLATRYEGLSEQQQQDIDDAIDAGRACVDLVVRPPAHAGPAAVQLGAVLDEADVYCREGRLLALETPPSALAYREWYLRNFVAQCAGGPPEPWTGPLD